MSGAPAASGISGLDALLVFVTIAWGVNLSVIKVALREFPPYTFNALRLVLATLAYIALVVRRDDPGRKWVAAGDWPRVLVLGLVGGTLYQLLFMYGVARTSVANTGLIFGASPVFISLLSAGVGHERVPWLRWVGGALSLAGLYLVVGGGAGVSRESLLGDAVVTGSMLCWSIYSVASRPLLGRYSPLVLTAWATGIGTLPYAAGAIPTLLATSWDAISAWSWSLMIGSSLICLVLSYAAWYTGVQRLGATRTSAYSNLTPIAAMVAGWLWLGEAVSTVQLAGAVAILSGVFLTRLSPIVLIPLIQAPEMDAVASRNGTPDGPPS